MGIHKRGNMIKPNREWEGKINDIVLTGKLKLSDLECPCCHAVMITRKILFVAAEIKRDYGDKVVITSCYRCELHNMKVKGVEGSRHLYGEAIDLQPRDPEDTETITRIYTTYRIRYKVIRYATGNYLHIQEK